MAILKVPVSKGGQTVDIDTDAIHETAFALALAEGLKVLMNKGMSKITVAKLEGEELAKAQAAAMEVAQKNFENIMSGNVKSGRGGKSAKTGVPGVVMTEARRLAKAVVKDQLREAKIKISHVPAKDLTEAANRLIEADASYIEQAKANIEARAQAPKPTIDIASLVKVDPKLVAKANEKAAAAKAAGTLSKTQAGKPAKRKGSGASANA